MASQRRHPLAGPTFTPCRVTQTKLLCGAAAAAMLFRYRGDGQADPNQFAPQLDRTADGIAADVLEQAIEDRGRRVVRS